MNIISVMQKFSYLFKLQTSNTIVSNVYNRLFVLNAYRLHYMSFRDGLDMVDFAANFTKAFKKSTFYLESVVLMKVVHLPLVYQSERSLRYFHLGRISDLFSIHRLSSHTLLAAEKNSG